MFSWPMRHHSLLVLFFTFVALLLSTYPLEKRTLTKSISRPLMSIVLIAVIFTLYLGYNEVRLGAFADRLKKQDIETSLDELGFFYTIDYLRYPLIEKTSPYLTKRILENRDPKLASRLLPYLKDLVEIQGSHWQWFNLSQTYFVLNMHAEAKKAINKAIDLWPVEGKYWSFQHYLNMLEVSEKTDRPLEDFLPIPPGGDAKDLDGMFDFEGRKFIEM
jgi:tetratricopeptide (TPR) repeat protein